MQTSTHLDSDPIPLDGDHPDHPPPECRPFPLDADPTQMQTHVDADPLSCDQWCMLGSQPPPMNRMTHRSKNITLPQTSFAGGNNELLALNVYSK